MALPVRTLWSAVGIALLAVLSWTVASHAVPELVLVFSAIVIAEGMRPPVEWLRRRGIPRPFAILAVLAAAIAALVGLGWITFAPLIAQIARLVDDMPHFMNVAQHEFAAYQQFLHKNAQVRSLLAEIPAHISAYLQSKVGFVLQAPLVLAAVVKNAFLIVLIAFFWLTASPSLAAFVLSLAAPEHRPATRTVLDELSAKTGGYLRGVLINMAVIGVVSFGGVALLGVPYALLLGVVAALTESIPIVGPLIGGGVAVIVALLAAGPQKGLEVAALYLVIQQIEGNTLVPLVMNRVVALSPLAIIVALVIGSALLGIPGAILAVPIAAILQVLVLAVVAPAVRARNHAVPIATLNPAAALPDADGVAD
jgi:predicted PurR-regulated permease PerM